MQQEQRPRNAASKQEKKGRTATKKRAGRDCGVRSSQQGPGRGQWRPCAPGCSSSGPRASTSCHPPVTSL
eukprot:1129640-Rhodomonas_salina.1